MSVRTGGVCRPRWDTAKPTEVRTQTFVVSPRKGASIIKCSPVLRLENPEQTQRREWNPATVRVNSRQLDDHTKRSQLRSQVGMPDSGTFEAALHHGSKENEVAVTSSRPDQAR